MPIAKESSNFEPAPAGTHCARCYGCIALGTQHSEIYADAVKLMLLFELPFEKIQMADKGEMPMTVSKEYTLSLNKKANLRKHLDAWRGRSFTNEELAGFEVSKVVGAPCQLTIVHQQSNAGSTYAKIESITGLAKGMKCPDQVHKSIKYEIEQGMDETFKNLPEWIRKKISACEEWQDHSNDGTSEPLPEESEIPSDEEDSVPF